MFIDAQQYYLCVILPPIALPDVMKDNTKMLIIPVESIFSREMHSKNHSMKNEIYHSTRILIFCDFFIFELMQKVRPESNFSIHFVNVSARGNILLSTSFRTI